VIGRGRAKMPAPSQVNKDRGSWAKGEWITGGTNRRLKNKEVRAAKGRNWCSSERMRRIDQLRSYRWVVRTLRPSGLQKPPWSAARLPLQSTSRGPTWNGPTWYWSRGQAIRPTPRRDWTTPGYPLPATVAQLPHIPSAALDRPESVGWAASPTPVNLSTLADAVNDSGGGLAKKIQEILRTPW